MDQRVGDQVELAAADTDQPVVVLLPGCDAGAIVGRKALAGVVQDALARCAAVGDPDLGAAGGQVTDEAEVAPLVGRRLAGSALKLPEAS